MMKKGFTLIELLIVIAIIGILASILLGRFTESRRVAQDTRLVAITSSFKTALALYYLDHNQYPITTEDNTSWMPICNSTRPDFVNQLRPYMDADLFELADCSRILYYSDVISSDYETYCKTPAFTTQQGYILVFSTSTQKKFDEWFFWGDATENWHCRSYLH